jgi:predicted N-acyltransferase
VTAGVAGRLIAGAAGIGAARWNALANPGGADLPHPFTTFEFFHALEASGSATAETGWQPCHLLIDDRALMPLYLKSHSYGEYVFDQAWADALERAGGAYYPKLQCAVPFTPVTGPRLLAADDDGRRMLLKAAAGAARRLGASSLHITFPRQAEWEMAGAAGYLLRTGQQFHWENHGYRDFDQFLGELSSSKRKNLRKERASVRAAGVTFEWLTGDAITEAHWDRFFDFYMDTGGRKWGTPYLTREFFSLLGDGLGHQILLVIAKRDGAYIAGALNLFGEGVLFGRNWGASAYVPFLHFETCYYQAIDFAIARGLKRVEAGAQGEHKLLRGYMPVPTYSAHVIAHPGLARAVDDFLDAERAAVGEHIAELAAHGPFKKSDA